MPCLRQRMHCRRGNNRGHFSGQPSSSITDSSFPSSDNYTGCYPATRSGRGRGHLGHFQFEVGSPHIPASSANIPAHYQTAQLRFSCSLNRPIVIATITVEFNRPIVIATITVEFKEEPPCSDAVKTGDGQEISTINKQGTPQSAVMKRKVPSCSENQDTGHEDNQGCSKRGCLNDKEDKQAEDDDMDAYGCPVVEKPPSSHDA